MATAVDLDNNKLTCSGITFFPTFSLCARCLTFFSFGVTWRAPALIIQRRKWLVRHMERDLCNCLNKVHQRSENKIKTYKKSTEGVELISSAQLLLNADQSNWCSSSSSSSSSSFCFCLVHKPHISVLIFWWAVYAPLCLGYLCRLVAFLEEEQAFDKGASIIGFELSVQSSHLLRSVLGANCNKLRIQRCLSWHGHWITNRKQQFNTRSFLWPDSPFLSLWKRLEPMVSQCHGLWLTHTFSLLSLLSLHRAMAHVCQGFWQACAIFSLTHSHTTIPLFFLHQTF